MEPAATEAAATPVDGDGGDFVVHTKHTCDGDGCFMTPILGKRYASPARPNYDLCARCFRGYDGPLIGFEEVVLLRDKKHSSEFVLKLKIEKEGDAQVRRINVSQLWDRSTGRLSFEKLMSIAFDYAKSEEDDDSALGAFIVTAKATYIDGDGDKITMTSDKELEDSFFQAVKNFPKHKPFRITVSSEGEGHKARGRGYSGGGPWTGYSGKAPGGGKAGMAKRIQHWKMQPPVMAPRKFEKNFFIHARHTCDGCSKSPIIGTRYHATKIPDFDLCEECFQKWEGDKSDFKPEIHDRDRRMQQKWLKKQLCESLKMPTKIAGMWNKADGDISEFLKKVQESWGSIESATVHASPPCPGFASAAPKKEDAAPPAERKEEDEAPSAEKKEENESKVMEEEGKTDRSLSSVEPLSLIVLAKWDTELMQLHELGFLDDRMNVDVLERLEASYVAVDSSEKVTVQKAVEQLLIDRDASGSLGGQEYAAGSKKSPAPKVEPEPVEKTPGSPDVSNDGSFLSDADGQGSIAEVIGRTLDVCVQAMEEAMGDEMKEIGKVGSSGSPGGKASVDEDVAAAAAMAVDAFSVASSMVSDILKETGMSASNCKGSSVVYQSNDGDEAASSFSTIAPSVVTGATILKSDDGAEKAKEAGVSEVEAVKVEDVSDSEDEWSVVSDAKAPVKSPESVSNNTGKAKVMEEEDKTDRSLSSVEPLSPTVFAKWDTELFQLHELGFLDDRMNVDVLERLEASYVAVDSSEKVTVQKAVEQLLKDLA